MALLTSKESYITIDINSIVPNNFNPNKMPIGTYKKLKNSIEKFGILNPVIVRQVGDKFEIVDGFHRTKVAKELGFVGLLCKVIKASEEEAKMLVMTSTIRGRQDIYESAILSKEFENKDGNTLSACNLDKNKLERKTKFTKTSKLKIAAKDEKDSDNVYPIENYKKVLLITLSNDDYDKVLKKLEEIDTDLPTALKKILAI